MTKIVQNSENCNLTLHCKHMTSIFDSNYFKTIIYTKWCCVSSFVHKKPSLSFFTRESDKNPSKHIKTQLNKPSLSYFTPESDKNPSKLLKTLLNT